MKKFRTKKGSIVTVQGNRVTTGEFNWLEEDACIDCVPVVSPDFDMLTWECSECGGGAAELYQVLTND